MLPLRTTAAAPIIALLTCGVSAPDPPTQPVAFSHRVHAGVNQIGCTMCHAYVERSIAAGVPSMQTCNGCHKFVGTDKPSIQLVNEAFQQKRQIEWVRIYRLPDHVFFTHQRHQAAHIPCTSCHGDVANMDVVREAQPLTMRFCLRCHDGRQAARDCLTCHK